MNASDLDDHSFVPLGHKDIGIKAHCLSYGFAGIFGWLAYEKSHRRCTPQVPTTGLPSKDIDGRTAKGFQRDLWRPSLAERS